MTTTPITAARLQEIAALCEAATPGPWSAGPHCETVDGPSWPVCTIAYDDERRPVLDELDPGQHVHQDARLIAASRTAIPELLAEIARLQSDLDHTTAHDGDHLSKASRRMVDTVMDERDALRLEVARLNAQRADDVHAWHATESDLAHNRRRADEAERELVDACARTAALEAGLRDILGDYVNESARIPLEALLDAGAQSQGAT